MIYQWCGKLPWKIWLFNIFTVSSLARPWDFWILKITFLTWNWQWVNLMSIKSLCTYGNIDIKSWEIDDDVLIEEFITFIVRFKAALTFKRATFTKSTESIMMFVVGLDENMCLEVFDPFMIGLWIDVLVFIIFNELFNRNWLRNVL